MDDPAEGAGGMISSLRRAGRSFVGLLRARAEILGVELQEEKVRTLDLLVWAAVAVGLGAAGVLLAIGILAFFLWGRFGYPGVIALAVAVILAAALLFRMLRRRILEGPAPFATTIAEIGKDLECLRARD